MIGKTLGHYRVGVQLGRGGMGEVYLADDLNLNRKVALEFLTDPRTRACRGRNA
jgi:serine/threonine protein kinase